MVKVLKFGGSSLADAEQFKKVAAIIKAEPERRYVVASAPGKRFSDDIKVTDMLYDCYKLVKKNQPIDDAFALIEDRYNGIIKDLGMKLWLQPEFDRIKEQYRYKRKIHYGMYHLICPLKQRNHASIKRVAVKRYIGYCDNYCHSHQSCRYFPYYLVNKHLSKYIMQR